MDWLFRFFFKYPAVVFDQGDFTFAVSRSTMLAIGGAAALAVAALITYRAVAGEDSPRDRAVLLGLRLGAVALLVFCLSRPLLILKAAVPQQNFLGVLIDDSRSMTIADNDGQPRTAFVQQELAQPESPLLKALSQRFVLRFFRFSSTTDRVDSPADLTVRRHGLQARAGARARARRAGRAAARRPGHGERRRRHVGRVARRAAREPQGALDSGVHGRRRPGSLRARHSGHARRNAAVDPQGHLAHRRRRHQPDRLRRHRRSRSTSKTRGALSARSR